jgi:signal transduction histidine kinase
MTEPLRILLVDDDHVDRLAVKRLLRQAGLTVEVEERADRAGALAAAEQQRFDCALLDYRLPGTDGLSLLRDLRDKGITVPVVALTGQGDEEVAVELMKAGAADYLNKNALSPERLERSLRYALSLHRADEERRLLLEREQQARLQAQAANRAKDEFLATLSHELRTPLNAILGWAQLLASGQLDEDTARRAVSIIERNTRLQAQLIDDLLDISRIITGKLRLELRGVLVRSILESAIDSIRPTADAKGVSLVCDVGPHSNGILCDPARMQQVIWNLLSNAIKFTPAGGRVTLAEERRDGMIVLTIMDTGAGIDPVFLPHVFDRFRQQDPGSTRTHGGLGLGLSIVHYLVELHGGTIEARSDGEGQGATFIITVPVAPMTTNFVEPGIEPDTPVASITDLPFLGGLRILVVDNEVDALALVREILENCGATITAVESAAEALQEIGRRRPDVLVSDIAMPGEDGYSLVRKVRAMDDPSRPLPAVALTAYASEADRERTLGAGYQAHLPKPVDPRELAATIAALAGKTAAAQGSRDFTR